MPRTRRKPASPGDDGRTVKAGKVILICEPWITVVDWTMRSKVCAFCWEEPDDLNACNGCRYCFYCDKSCQTLDWRREQKHECGLLKAAVDELSPDAVEMKGYGSLQILFLKALNRCAVNYKETHPGIDGKSARDYITKELLVEYRLESVRVLVPVGVEAVLEFRDRIARRINCALDDLIGPQCMFLMSNLVKTREDICGNTGTRDNPEDLLGFGIYLEPHRFRSESRENSEWVYDRTKIVVKALADIPRYRSLDQVTLTPFFALKNIMVRAERVDVWSWKMEMAGAISPGWSCDCVYCSDKFEAEILPIKCVTPSCMEPIPSDKRALEPCQQCGAMNGQRLAEAKAQISEFTRILLEFGGRNEKPLYIQHGPEWMIGKMVALVREMEAPRVVLHPDNMIRMGAAYTLTMGMALSKIPAMGFRYAEMCRDTVQRYYGRGLHPHYALFLMLYAKCGLAMCGTPLTKKNTEAAKNMLRLALQKKREFLALPKQAEKKMSDFFRTDSFVPDVKPGWTLNNAFEGLGW